MPRPEGEFAVHDQRRLGYRDARVEASRIANAFIGTGIGMGDPAETVRTLDEERLEPYWRGRTRRVS